MVTISYHGCFGCNDLYFVGHIQSLWRKFHLHFFIDNTWKYTIRVLVWRQTLLLKY